MYIKDILNQGRSTFSFEIFPPKKEANIESVLNTAKNLVKYEPDFISVTYGAGGGTSKYTTRIASFIQNEYKLTVLAHLTCLSSTKDKVTNVLKELSELKVKNIMALRGDIPKDMTDFPNPLHYRYATDLIKQIKQFGGFCIGGACYPEGHPEAKSKDADIEVLKLKQDAGCDFLITQLFFDNNTYYEFVDKAVKKGVALPIIPGIMPVINANQILKTCELSQATLTPKFKRMISKYQDNPDALKQAGIAYATEQITDLLSNNVCGIHLYTMNNPDISKAIKENVSYLY